MFGTLQKWSPWQAHCFVIKWLSWRHKQCQNQLWRFDYNIWPIVTENNYLHADMSNLTGELYLRTYITWTPVSPDDLHQNFLITLSHRRPTRCLLNLMYIAWESYPYLPISYLAFITKTWHQYGLHGPISLTIYRYRDGILNSMDYMWYENLICTASVADIVMKPLLALAPFATGVSRLEHYE